MAQQGIASRSKPVPASDEKDWVKLRSSVVSFGHFHPGYQCGICGQLFGIQDRCIGLIGNKSSTSTWLVTRPFVFPDYLHGPHAVDGWALCRQSACWPCSKSPESCALHLDCYEVFKQGYSATDWMERLWIAACWRKPWQGAPRLAFPEHYAIGLEAVAEVGEKHDLRFMSMLPPEIVQMIRGYCAASLFWKFAAAMDLCHRFRTSKPSSLMTVPLHSVSEWRRDGKLVTSELSSLPPIVRITIDARGVSTIDRVESTLSQDLGPRDNEGYIVQDIASCGDVEATLKDGHLRLTVPTQQQGLQIWNTTLQYHPPNGTDGKKSRWQMLGSVQHASWFTAINLGAISGLTFFMSGGIICAIHAHSSRKPVAELPSACMPEWNRRHLSWVYVPVAPGDEIEEICFRGQEVGLARLHSLVIRMKLAGAILVGTLPASESIVTFGSSPATLVYGRKEMDRIHAIGTYSKLSPDEWPETRTRDDVLEVPQLRRTVYGIHVDSLNRASTSIAPMEDVVRVRIYTRLQPPIASGESEIHNCGMILEYKNGGRRAVGECRVGVDKFYDIEAPRCLRISNMYRVGADSGDTRSLVSFFDTIPDDMDRFVPYYYMSGTLVIRFLHNQSTFWAELLDGERVLRKAEV